MRAAEDAAIRQVLEEHAALCREADEIGAPVHVCGGSIDETCAFILDRAHALGAAVFGCWCRQCARLNAERAQAG